MEFENLLTLIKTMSGSKLTELKYEENGVKIRISKHSEEIQAVHREQECTVPEESSYEKKGNVVTSPLVGVFYAAPAEGAEPFVKVGTQVKKGQSLAIVEAMKLMNEIESEFDGTVTEIFVENGAPVEYGQPLFQIV